MLSRRIKQHVKESDFVAVIIDLSIVVLGVFIGFQLNNWNANRADERDYRLALDRYVVEARSNLAQLETTGREFENFFAGVPDAIDVLRSCEDTPENLRTVNVGLNRLGGTFGISLKTEALADLRSSPRLLAQQSPQTRQVLSDAAFNINLLLREGRFIEELPLRNRIEANPILDVGPLVNRTAKYHGIDFSRDTRALLLNVPLSQACEDDALLKSFYTWEKWQSVFPLLVSRLQAEIEVSLEKLE